MKRIAILRHLHEHGCFLIREGAKYSVVLNPVTEKTSTVPRHNEVDSNLAKKICKDLSIPEIKGK
ncbi:MAG TPA: addiction module toxin, HicA family [Candidatus Paceibacterota bacterium]